MRVKCFLALRVPWRWRESGGELVAVESKSSLTAYQLSFPQKKLLRKLNSSSCVYKIRLITNYELNNLMVESPVDGSHITTHQIMFPSPLIHPPIPPTQTRNKLFYFRFKYLDSSRVFIMFLLCFDSRNGQTVMIVCFSNAFCCGLCHLIFST